MNYILTIIWALGTIYLIITSQYTGALGSGAVTTILFFLERNINTLRLHNSELNSENKGLNKVIAKLKCVSAGTSIGELTDRYTIESIKASKITDYKQSSLYSIETALDYKLELLDQNGLLWKQFVELRDKLFELNLHQWELEDRVRLQQDWKSAVAARANNTERVRIKNEINKLYGDTEEIKQYQERKD